MKIKIEVEVPERFESFLQVVRVVHTVLHMARAELLKGIDFKSVVETKATHYGLPPRHTEAEIQYSVRLER